MLKLDPKFSHYPILRTREDSLMNTAEILVDCGFQYKPDKLRFDHIQKDFLEFFSANCRYTTLSSAGLVYKHFGRELIQRMVSVNPDELEFVFKRTYRGFIENIDASDTGIEQCSGAYHYNEYTGVAYDVRRMNDLVYTGMLSDDVFEEAVELMKDTFTREVKLAKERDIPTWRFVADAFSARKKYDPAGHVLVLHRECPWEDVIQEINSENVQVWYCIHPKAGQWIMTRTVASDKGMDSTRLSVAYEMGQQLPGVLHVRKDGGEAVVSSVDAAVKLADALMKSKVNRFRAR